MGYATGRTRTLTFEGTFSGAMTYSWDGYVDGEGYNQNFLLSVDAFCGATLPSIRDFGFTIGSNVDYYGTGHSLAGTVVSYDAQMGSFGDGSPGTHVVGTVDVEPWALDHTSGGATESGSYSFSVEVAEYFELADVPVGEDYLEDGYPKWGDDGVAYFRGMPASAIRFYEVVPSGAATNLTVTAPGIAINISSTTLSEFEILRGHIVSASCEGIAQETTLPAGSCYVTVPEGYEYSFDYTGDGVTNHADTDTGAACSYSGVRGSTNQNFVSVNRAYIEPTHYKWDLRNYRYGELTDEALTWKIYDQDEATAAVELSVTGSGTREVTQNREDITVNISGNKTPPGPDGVDEHNIDTLSYCNARIKGSSLVAIDEDEHNWRTWIHGKQYGAFDLAHSFNYALTSASTSGWTASGLTLASGVTLTTTSTSGTVTKAFTTPINSEAYRFLMLKVKSVGSQNVPFKVSIDGRYWNVTTGNDGEVKQVFIDTCCSTDDTWITDTCSTRWPVDWDYGEGIAGLPNSTTPAWGINSFSEITLSLPASSQLVVSEISLRRSSFNKASFIPDLGPETLLWTVEDDNDTYGWTNIYATCDGRCVDLPDQYWVQPTGGEPYWYFVHYTIAQMADLFKTMNGYSVNGVPGGSSEIDIDFPDAYHTDERHGFFLGGAGYLAQYSGESVTWSVQDQTKLQNTIVQAQALYDWVQVYPGAGDVFGGTAYDVATPLGTHWHGHGRVQGLCYSSNKVPAAGVEITSSPDRGTATTDALGSYFTGGPYPKAESVVWTASNLPASGITNAQYDGSEKRYCWRGGGNDKAIDYVVRANRHHFRLGATDTTTLLGHSGEDLAYNENFTSAKRVASDYKSILELRLTDGVWSIVRSYE